MSTSVFSRNIWFLIPLSRGGQTTVLPPCPADAHAIIDYFKSGSTN